MNNLNIQETLNFIVTLQKNSCCNNNCPLGCTSPFLGPNNETCYNTRPITLFTCCTGTNWTMPYELNGTTGTSTVFRIENVEGNCATFRVLIANEDGTYSSTDSFFTMNLECICCIRCLGDTLIEGI